MKPADPPGWYLFDLLAGLFVPLTQRHGLLGFLSYVTPMMSNRSPVELETKFAPEMLRYSTAEAREENSVAAAAKEVCAAFILSNAHTQEKPSSGIEMDKPNRGSRAVWQVLAQMSSDLSGSGNSQKEHDAESEKERRWFGQKE